MKALISGQAATAVYFDNNRAYSTNLDSGESFIEREEWEVLLLFADADDIQQLDSESSTEILRELQQAWEKDRSLQLILILLDSSEDKETRLLAADCFNEFFSNNKIQEYIANRLYSTPLPPSADLVGAIQVCSEQSLTVAEEFLNTLKEDQKEIYKRYKAWEELPLALFGSPDDKQSFYFDAVRFGAFRLFATEREKKNWAIIQLLTHPYFRGNAKARTIFQAWAAPFKESATNVEFEREPKTDLYAEIEIEAERTRRSIKPRQAFEQAEKQRNAIKELLIEGNQELALRFTEQLIASQRRSSDPEHRAKSLCDLAQFAKILGSPELQLEFAKKAIAEAPTDAWSYATLGDAYRQLSDYQSSQDAYHQAGVYGDVRASLVGRAEVLKDIGQSEDALKILDQCIQDYPTDIVALNARAAALADFGKLKESLNAYNEIISNFYSDPVTLNGRAQVLREMGRLEEALREFEEIIGDYPNESYAQHARGEVLRELGYLEESKQVFADLTKKFPLASEAWFSYAKVLRDTGQFNEAKIQYQKLTESHPLNSVGYLGLADTYRKLRDFNKAIEIYDLILDRFSRLISARIGKASILVSQGDYVNALKLLPVNLPATNSEWVAYHIRGMAYMRSGKLQRAERTFEWGLQEIPWATQRQYFQTALASLRIQQGRYIESIGLVKDVKDPSIEPIAHVLTMHAFGEMGDKSRVEQSYYAIRETSAPVVIDLRDILAARYIHNDSALKQMSHQIFLQECESLLLAA